MNTHPLTQLLQLLTEKSTPAPLHDFAQRLYADEPASELAARNLTDLYGAAVSNWRFVRDYPGPDAKIRVYNPDFENHGWQSTHTVVNVLSMDMPFLLDTVRLVLNRRGITVHALLHPLLQVARDGQGNWLESTADARDESLLHVETDRQAGSELAEIRAALESALHKLQQVTTDWQAMRERMNSVTLSGDAEGQRFLPWLADGCFVFLGCCEYRLDDTGSLQRVADSGLGLLRGAEPIIDGLPPVSPPLEKGGPGGFAKAASPLWQRGDYTEVENPPQPPFFKGGSGLLLRKTPLRAPVHRAAHMDYLAVPQTDSQEQYCGEWRFIGLYTAPVYHTSIHHIPLLQHKVQNLFPAYPPAGHQARALNNILESYPRDELFQISPDLLREHVQGILQLEERQRVRAFVRTDVYHQFVSCIVYVPRDSYDTAARKRMQAILCEMFGGGEVSFSVNLPESMPAQVHFMILTPGGEVPAVDVAELESRLADTVRSWRDSLHAALLEHCGEARSTALLQRYGEAFSAAYREDFAPRYAVYDIERLEILKPAADLALNLYRPPEAPEDTLHFKLYHLGEHLALSDVLPLLENMGVRVIRESSYPIHVNTPLWIQAFVLSPLDKREKLDLPHIRQAFQDTFQRAWCGEIENDRLNRLVLTTRMGWREITVLRAYCKYLLQTGSTFSRAYMEQALCNNPHISHDLFVLFETRNNPALDAEVRALQAEAVAGKIRKALENVESLDEDRILRLFMGVIQATLRTNFYQHPPLFQRGEEGLRGALAFKFDPSQVPGLPDPRPQFEIFVYSPQVEGVHLRGGSVARGGLRWSDRLEDFRTEILGLVKAQMVKNTVIVPVGSKGGFVVKNPPPVREALAEAGKACYQTFIRGLLDLTDNIVDGQIIPPARTVRHDGDDPYLVVAADKGTATFSDLANSVAAEYGFWLGDAFASGGSAGYDHKKIAITARGAWEAVKRHFRELGRDIQNEDFTVVGIGGMSGDVFGNGMLLSRHIKLVGAISHKDIFLDPDPDPAVSYRERERLFQLPRAAWTDYDPALISAGGGVFPRKAKSIPLSPQVRQLLGVKAEALPPAEVIRALLRAEVDLLWNGGIGTYVKASTEHHSEVGDHANDALRVNGNELRCKVVGEGGNLGLTQLGRIEYARHGGRINTDAVDNSGGVDCSDHEVNIKILLNSVVAAQDMTLKQRNRLLAEMTEDVAAAVLADNYLQTQSLSLSEALAPRLLDLHTRMLDYLEHKGTLDRKLEFLPAKKQLAARAKAGTGLTRPELCVLLAYAKLDLYPQLLASDLPDTPYLQAQLSGYFPPRLREPFADAIAGHRLHREIIATRLTNQVINYAGCEYVYALHEDRDAPHAVCGFYSAWEVFGMAELWAQVHQLDNQVDAAVQIRLLRELRKHTERAARWLLRNQADEDIQSNVEKFRPGVVSLDSQLADLICPADRDSLARTAADWQAHAIPAPLAEQIARLTLWLAALDIITVARATETALDYVAHIHFMLGTRLKLHWLRDHISALPRSDRWQTLARAALRDELYRTHRELTAVIVRSLEDGTLPEPGDHLETWLQSRDNRVKRYLALIEDISSQPKTDLAMLSVALREVRGLV